MYVIHEGRVSGTRHQRDAAESPERGNSEARMGEHTSEYGRCMPLPDADPFFTGAPSTWSMPSWVRDARQGAVGSEAAADASSVHI